MSLFFVIVVVYLMADTAGAFCSRGPEPACATIGRLFSIAAFILGAIYLILVILGMMHVYPVGRF